MQVTGQIYANQPPHSCTKHSTTGRHVRSLDPEMLKKVPKTEAGACWKRTDWVNYFSNSDDQHAHRHGATRGVESSEFARGDCLRQTYHIVWQMLGLAILGAKGIVSRLHL